MDLQSEGTFQKKLIEREKVMPKMRGVDVHELVFRKG